MLARRPKWEDAVFGGFSREKHVRVFEPKDVQVEKLVCGVDFGFAGAFVCVWLAILREKGKQVVWVVDEMVARHQTVSVNAAGMKGRGVGSRQWSYCDVAGSWQRNGQTGKGDEASMLREAGFCGEVRVGCGLKGGIEVDADLVSLRRAVRMLVDPRVWGWRRRLRAIGGGAMGVRRRMGCMII